MLNRIKTRLLGFWLLHLASRSRQRLLAHWTQGGTDLEGSEREHFDALSAAVDRSYYAARTSTRRREQLKHLCMGASSGVRWAEKYSARGFPDDLTPHIGMFGFIETALRDRKLSTVHQVACCSGREVAYYAERYPDLEFVGSDVDPEIVDWLRKHWVHLPNLRFEVLALELTAQRSWDVLDADLVIASGGLHYMDTASLHNFCAQARTRARYLTLSQPCNVHYAVSSAVESGPRVQLSWSHPYCHILQEHGWSLTEQVEFVPEPTLNAKNFSCWAE